MESKTYKNPSDIHKNIFKHIPKIMQSILIDQPS